MRRREFISGLGGAAAWPLVARAQPVNMPVVGFLTSESSGDTLWREFVAAFRRGLGDIGYVEGRNVAFEFRSAENNNDRLSALALELVRRQVAVIVTRSTAAALAAKTATTTIPIVFNIGADPVKLGLVASLNRPGANVTGFTGLTNAVEPKKLELLHELVPQAAVIAMLVNPTNPNAEPDMKDVQVAAGMLGLRMLVLNASDQSGIETAFVALVQRQASALLVSADIFFHSAADQLVALASRHRVPAIYDLRLFTAAGGLMSYGANLRDVFRLVGNYAGRILKGEKPAQLPVQQSTKIELVINLKTAKALGLTFPTAFLVRADEVIE